MHDANHYDAIIVGSGFGGSVMAYNLTLAGMRVCLLERGDAHPPGKFARTPDAAEKQLWDPSNKLYGLYNVWSFQGLDCVVSSGLGGGSLIYANVIREKNADWFEMLTPGKNTYQAWPITYAQLKPHYDKVKKILTPTEYPITKEPYNDTPKAQALISAANAAGLTYVPLDLAITFGNNPNNPIVGEELAPRFNLHNTKRYACRLCGECYLGCNFGSKNTLDLTYLSHAMERSNQNQLAKLPGYLDIKTLCEVTKFQWTDPDWKVSVSNYSEDAKKKNDMPKEFELRSTYLILSAGSLGTTFLMLKNRTNLEETGKKLPISSMLGKNFSGNGDVLNTADNCSNTINGKQVLTDMRPYLGPVITGAAMSTPGPTERDDRFYIEDWSYTNTMIWLFKTAGFKTTVCRWFKLAKAYLATTGLFRPNHNLGFDINRFLDSAYDSVSSFTMVGMGMDRSDGVFNLSEDENFLELDSCRKNSNKYYDNLFKSMEKMAEALGARKFWCWETRKETRLKKFPSWGLNKTITVHPLGGCPMGDSIATGVVGPCGEVFNQGNLFIADGSIMPAAVGPNPSFTIAALSDLIAQGIIKRWRGSEELLPCKEKVADEAAKD